MSFDATINAYFVTTTPSSDDKARFESAAQDFALALKELQRHIPEEHIRQLKSNEGFPLIASGQLTKKDVFIFDHFEGDFFKQLQNTKSLILGPRCVLTCLSKSEPIPLGTSPIYTAAMRNLQVSTTGIAAPEKERLRILIQWMGGHCFMNFGRTITHLVSNTIKSTKYEYATMNGIPVMHIDWVQHVWERSCLEDVVASDEEFDKFRLPIFFGANITCTGLDYDKKNKVMTLVNGNGGTYHRAFRSQLVDIVITERSATNSDKYQAALRYKKDILTPEWIFDSVERGFALPLKKYVVKSLKVSTPTKGDQSLADFNASDSQLSDLSRISAKGGRNLTTVNDTIVPSAKDEAPQKQNSFVVPAPVEANDLPRQALKKAAHSGAHYRLVYDEICPKLAKAAGAFLDGCCIYLSGFRPDEREKLNRILNVGGATRYDVVSEKISHIIVGQFNDVEFKAWSKAGLSTGVNIVRLDWLLESIKRQQPANENVYRVSMPTSREPDAPSPSSKRTLRSMNRSFKQPAELPMKKKLFGDTSEVALRTPLASSTERQINPEDDEEEEQNTLLAQYSQENVAVPLPPAPLPTASKTPPAAAARTPPAVAARAPSDVTAPTPQQPRAEPSMADSNLLHTVDYETLNFFQGMAVYIDQTHFPDEFYSQMISECEAAQGNVVSATFPDPIDYAIVSFERTFDAAQLPTKPRHIITELYVESCLKQNTLVPIEYFHRHIPHTADALPLTGMTIVISTYTGLERDFIDSMAQLLGAKVNKSFVRKERPLLVCCSAEGQKYEGALKWAYPVVTAEWLVQCAAEGRKLPYTAFLVGQSPHDFPTSPAAPRPKDNVENEVNDVRMSLAVDPGSFSPQNKLTPSPIALPLPMPEGTPLRNKRVTELLGSAKCPLIPLSQDSPRTPNNAPTRPTYNFDYFEELVADVDDEEQRCTLREVIKHIRENQTPELERLRRQAYSPNTNRVPTPKGLPEFCSTPAFEERMRQAYRKRRCLSNESVKPDTPIDVLRKRVMIATCREMGIPIEDRDYGPDDFEPSDSETDPLVASLVARMRKTPEPSPSSTPHRSKGSGPQDTPNTSVPLPPRVSTFGRSSINFDKISFEDSTVAAAASPKATTVAAVSPEVKQITDYLRDVESRRQSLKRTASRHLETPAEPDTQFVQAFESEQFGGGTEDMVGWRDPGEFSKQRRSMAPPPPMEHEGTPRFSISCSDEATRDDVIQKILQLGGEVCENLVNFDVACSHFVCERPNRGEKMLGCISSGKWILSLKYVEECFAKDGFICEELYEWGNARALNLPQLSQDEQIIALAAHRWRKQLGAKADGGGAFSGFRAILHIPDRNLDALKNVIKAGGGAIVDVQPPFAEKSDAAKATHCFVDVKKRPLSRADYDFLSGKDVQLYSQMYINSFLMNVGEVDAAKFQIKM